jgi:hypothetical protein
MQTDSSKRFDVAKFNNMVEIVNSLTRRLNKLTTEVEADHKSIQDMQARLQTMEESAKNVPHRESARDMQVALPKNAETRIVALTETMQRHNRELNTLKAQMRIINVDDELTSLYRSTVMDNLEDNTTKARRDSDKNNGRVQFAFGDNDD